MAKNLIENGEVFLQMVVQSMGNLYPDSVRIEGFRLAQCLMVGLFPFLTHIDAVSILADSFVLSS